MAVSRSPLTNGEVESILGRTSGVGADDLWRVRESHAALLARTEDAEKALAKIGVLAADGLTPHGWRKEALARIAALAGSSPAAEADPTVGQIVQEWLDAPEDDLL